jgi:hydroxymethylpyrimidine/phosphomethylpyrimidine kinase
MGDTPSIVLTIAGFDPSSGAGITADLKTVAAHGCYGLACITALTVQSTQGVRRVQPLDPGLINETLETLFYDFHISAVHIGMLGTGKQVAAVADFLDRHALPNIVLDPVLRSSSGTDLLDPEGIRLLIERLLPRATVTTPNIDEAGALVGLRPIDVQEMRAAACMLHKLGARGVVITGGHLDAAIDLLSLANAEGVEQEEFSAEKLASGSTHGTGCAFATAIACNLAQGKDLRDAVGLAKQYVRAAIESAYPLGKGIGPINHGRGK